MNDKSEDAVLASAELILGAVALSRALLDGDVALERLKASAIEDTARALGPPSLVEAASTVVSLLEAPGPSPLLGYYADAIHALSMEIDRLATGCE
jgi:hypothetical protein